MPCRCEESSSYENPATLAALNKVTRAGCDIRTILRRHGLEGELTQETRDWIAGHDRWDAWRIAEENARGERERVKQAALAKLSMDERRVLGL